jgi:hypothetical protein
MEKRKSISNFKDQINKIVDEKFIKIAEVL